MVYGHIIWEINLLLKKNKTAPFSPTELFVRFVRDNLYSLFQHYSFLISESIFFDLQATLKDKQKLRKMKQNEFVVKFIS